MSTNVSLDGTAYTIPAPNDTGWATQLSLYLIQLATSVTNRVRYDAAQTLTAPQKLQTATNIGAVSVDAAQSLSAGQKTQGNTNLGSLAIANNLSDLGSTATALTNLGITNANAILPVLPNRNVVINGSFLVDQLGSTGLLANSTAVSNPSNVYVCDQWLAFATTGSFQRLYNSQSDGRFSGKLTVSGSTTNPYIATRIESINCSHFVNQNIVISCRLATTGISTVTWELANATAADNSTYTTVNGRTGTFTTSGTMTAFSVAIAGGSMPSAVANGLQLKLSYVGTTSSATIEVQNVQIELGTVATAFEMRPYTTELQLCQRYYETSLPLGVTRNSTFPQRTGARNVMSINGTWDGAATVTFIVPKRATPTLTIFDPYSNTNNQASNQSTSVVVANITGYIGAGTLSHSGFIWSTSAAPTGFWMIHFIADARL